MKSGFPLMLTLGLIASTPRVGMADPGTINPPFLGYTEAWASQYGQALAVLGERAMELQAEAEQQGVSARWQEEVLTLAEDITLHLGCRSQVLVTAAETVGQRQCSEAIATGVNDGHDYIREWLPVFLQMPLEDEFQLVGAGTVGSLGLSQTLFAYSHLAGTLVCTRVPGGMAAMDTALQVHGVMSPEVEALSVYIEQTHEHALPALSPPDLERSCGVL